MLLSLVFSLQLKKGINYSVFLSLFLFIISTSSTIFGQSNQDHQGTRNVNGYDCGKSYFTDQMVSDALKIAFSDKGRESVRSYVGPLYDVKRRYLTWPIVQDEVSKELKRVTKWKLWREAIYQVVFNENGKTIDIIVRTSNKDFAKCWRVDSSQSETQSQEVGKAKGYYCGSRFIPNEHLEASAGFARKYIGKNRKYPAPYIGHLYDKDLGLMVWPIYDGNILYTSSMSLGSPYLIMIDPAGQVKDVVVRTHDYSFVKCMISNIDVPAYAWNEQRRVSVEPSRSGFDCNGVFFSDNSLQFASLMAQRSHSTRKDAVFPLKYNGPSFDIPCLLWPLKPSGSIIISGILPPYRLVLTPNFEIICVAIQGHYTIKKCERKTITSESLNHDENDYKCGATIFTHNKLISAADNACKEIVNYRMMFPKKYEGFTFDIPGPYLIYPIVKEGNFQNRKVQGSVVNYLVINYDCVIVGALTTDKTTNELKKCDIRPKRKN